MKPWPSIDRSLLSPSGRISKRARKAAINREGERLFPAGYWDAEAPSQAEGLERRRTSLLPSAKHLRDLAARGMSPRKYLKAAQALEALAADIKP